MKYFSKYIIVGCINTGLSFFVIAVLIYVFNTPAEFNNICGYIVGFLSSYILNKKFTFKSRAKPGKEMLKFFTVFIVAYGLNLLCLIFMVRSIGVNEMIAQITSGILYTTVSYFLNKYYVFKVR